MMGSSAPNKHQAAVPKNKHNGAAGGNNNKLALGIFLSILGVLCWFAALALFFFGFSWLSNLVNSIDSQRLSDYVFIIEAFAIGLFVGFLVRFARDFSAIQQMKVESSIYLNEITDTKDGAILKEERRSGLNACIRWILIRSAMAMGSTVIPYVFLWAVKGHSFAHNIMSSSFNDFANFSDTMGRISGSLGGH